MTPEEKAQQMAQRFEVTVCDVKREMKLK